jgi:hypothetical protein
MKLIRFAPTPWYVMAAQNEGSPEHPAASLGASVSGATTPAPAAVSPDLPHDEISGLTDQPEQARVAPTSKGSPSSEPTSKGVPGDWRQDMAAGDRAFLKTLERFENPAALAKAYKELTSKLSSGEIRAFKGPPDDATPEQIAAWRTDHGLPEDAAAYVKGLKFADGTVPGEPDQPLLASFAERAMNGHWTAEQFNQAVGWYYALQDQLAAQRHLADGAFKEQSSSELMRDWGTDYAINRNSVVQFLDRTFPQDFKIDLLNARLPDDNMLANHPAFSRAVLEIAKTLNPRGSVLPNASGAGLSSVESRIAEIEGKYMRATHGTDSWKSYWTGEAGARMQQEYRSLLAAREQARRGSV